MAVPLIPIAIDVSAFKGRASFTPSPVIAKLIFCLQHFYNFNFCSGFTRHKHAICSTISKLFFDAASLFRSILGLLPRWLCLTALQWLLLWFVVTGNHYRDYSACMHAETAFCFAPWRINHSCKPIKVNEVLSPLHLRFPVTFAFLLWHSQ
jgi:hypothetical protein